MAEKREEISVKNIYCTLCNSSNYIKVIEGEDYEYHSCTNTFSILRCTNCGHIYLSPKPAIKEFAKIYPANYYYTYFENRRFSIAKLIKNLLERKQVHLYKKLIGKEGKVLEIGSGTGSLLNKLKKINPRLDLQGIDSNPEVNKIARKKGIKVHTGFFEETNFPKNSLDLIIMNQVLEHINNPSCVIKKIRKILKMNGYLVIETPCFYSWDYKIFKNYWSGFHIPRHFSIFSKITIRWLLEKLGFKVIKITSLLSSPFWIISIHNFLDSKKFPKVITAFFKFYNPLLLLLFLIPDFFQILLKKPTSNMRVIAIKK